MRSKLLFVLIFLGVGSETLMSQQIDLLLEEQMVALERDVVRIYNEQQKFLRQDFRSDNELLAFESLITIYVDEILSLYDTFWRIRGTTLETQQNIAARCLIFRALTYLERTKQHKQNYTKACEDYKKALRFAQNESREPLLNTRLPHEVWVGRKLYTRLADLLDDRGKNFQMIACFQITDGLAKSGGEK